MIDRKTAWAALLILIVTFLLRLPAFWTPIVDVDEAQFAGFADWLLRSGLPYVSSLDTKPLGIYWFYEAVFRLFGRNNMIAVHVVTAAWVAVTALFCYLIAKEIYSRRAGLPAGQAGFWAALFYAIFTATFVPKFIATSITIVMMLPLTASIYCVLLWERSKNTGWMLLSGLLWGAACLFKYQAGINLFVIALYLLLARPLLRKGSGVRLREFATFIAGGAIVATLFSAYLRSIGVWDEFMTWSLGGSGAYVGAASRFTPFWKNLATRGGSFIASTLLIWILAIIAAVRTIRDNMHRDETTPTGRELVLIWLLLSIVPVCTGGKFYAHYFIQLLPALCVLAGGAAATFLGSLGSQTLSTGKKLLVALFIAGILIPATGAFVARIYAAEIYAAANEEDPAEYKSIGEYVKMHTAEDDTIFVWGFATPVYYYANRLGASRFLWCDWLTGRISGTPQAKDPSFDTSQFATPESWELFFQDMMTNKPVYFVDTSPGNHHDYGKYPIRMFPELYDFVGHNYELETTVDGADIYRLRPDSIPSIKSE